MKRSALFSFTLFLVVGCGKSQPATPAGNFNETQADTITPYGKVCDGSAVDNNDGSITFRTVDGTELTVPVTQTEAGAKYGTPTRTQK